MRDSTLDIAQALGHRRVVTTAPANVSDMAEHAHRTLVDSRLLRSEHPFRMSGRQFGCHKARFKRMCKNTARILTLSALSNLRMVCQTW